MSGMFLVDGTARSVHPTADRAPNVVDTNRPLGDTPWLAETCRD